MPVETVPKSAVDVIVIGAGPAGLHAAGLLQKADLDVAVIEARDRVGGRLESVPAGPGHLDLGPTWFWSNEPLVNAVVATAGLPIFPQRLEGDTMVQTEDGVRRVAGNQIDAPSSRLASGIQAIAEALAARLTAGTITFVAPVTRIADGDDGTLIVAAAGRSWIARRVVVALPPATALAHIDFGDLLAEPLRVLVRSTPVWMGATTKVVAHYERPFWRDTGLAGAAFSWVGPMREMHDMSGPDGTPAAIFGFAQPGPNQPAPTVGAIIAQLTALFGPEAATPVALHIKDWRSEPFTSPPNADLLQDYQTYGDPLYQQPTADGRLHFASTETSTIAPGHIEGALVAAERAASQIVQTLP